MKTNKFLAVMLLAVLAVGCTKDASHIRIISENMDGGSKIWVDPTDVSASATWIDGETIDINSVTYTIDERNNNFYLDEVPTGATRYAVYPATTNANGNDVEVTNNGSSGATITLNRLAVNFHDGGHDIIFPMAAVAGESAETMLFNHLTAGFKLTLSASSATTVSSVKVIVYGDAAVGAIKLNDVTYTVNWADDGLTTPVGEVGGITGDYDARYASVMYFDMNTSGAAGVEVNSTGKTFCIPVTVTNVKRISVVGYGNTGQTLFEKTQTLNNIPVQRNTMYTIPTIVI